MKMKNSNSNKNNLTVPKIKNYINIVGNTVNILGDAMSTMEKIKKPKKKPSYINNKHFYALMQEYTTNRDRKTLNLIGKQFLKIAENIIRKPNFNNYSKDRKNEMISDATFFMVKYIDTYDITRKNPFAFFSQIAFNAFKQNINKNKKHDMIFIPLHYVENAGKSDDNTVD